MTPPSPPAQTPQRIAVFASTSGHSGVDRAMQHLIPELCQRGFLVDQLKVRRHGPHLSFTHPNYRIIDLGTSHTYNAVFAIARYLKRNKPCVMLSDKDRVNRTALAARWLSGTRTPLVFSSGTTISIDLSHRGAVERAIQRWSMRCLYPKAQRVIVTCKGVADDMADYTGLAREKIHVVESPVIPDALLSNHPDAPDHPWLKEKTAPVILGVGELSDRKDFATLLRAFAKLDSTPAPRLIILGKGKRKEALLSLCDELGIRERVDFPGHVPDPYAYMAHASVFAFTSRWEGLGFVLIEALAMGCPVVSTDTPSGPSEILQNGKFGPLVPVGDVNRLAEELTHVIAHPPERNGLKQAAQPYTVSAATDAYLSAFGLAKKA